MLPPLRDQSTGLLTHPPAFTRQRCGGRFIAVEGPDAGDSVELGAHDAVTFGSSPSCSLALTDTTVSRQHLEARWEEGRGVVLRDLGSTNGTFFAGSRITEITIPVGAAFTIGRTLIKLVPDEEPVEPPASPSPEFGTLLGQDETMRRLFALLGDVSPTEATIIIEGETGTGKELVAGEIHHHSARANGPFVVFDCGAVPRELIESALFGHVKGAFTGAVGDRAGAFGEANGGTIFLDEIGELALDLQPALLRAIDQRMVRRVGDSNYRKVDVRIVAATHRDLRQEVAERRFREDLYYRLAVVRIKLPPLRERGADVERLAQLFVEQFTPAGRQLRLDPAALARLRQHAWPGNVRELRNVIERACVLAPRGELLRLDPAALPEAASSPALGLRTDLPYKEAKGQLVEVFEREYVLDLMRRNQNNLSAAAREAQLDRKHLRELVRKHSGGDSE
ncbi:MAG: sigma 54-dependent Fis family transcriptional regulator [Proteobacteria bacterium]|nr:sigma 54-dependent Fis family transcriptional regulator [Pseudomonadota bacterium]